jgi:hypothetical protein
MNGNRISKPTAVRIIPCGGRWSPAWHVCDARGEVICWCQSERIAAAISKALNEHKTLKMACVKALRYLTGRGRWFSEYEPRAVIYELGLALGIETKR